MPIIRMQSVFKSIFQKWDHWVGAKQQFSMDNRAFNYICLITELVLAYCLAFDIYIKQYPMCVVITALMVGAGIMYYYSRYKKSYKTSIIIYGILSYLSVAANYYFNDGIKGPTITLMVLTFILFVGISPKKTHIVWLILHLAFAFSLAFIEFNNPNLIKECYETKFDYYTDILSNYTMTLLFIFFIINYIRNYYYYQKKLSDIRAVDIEEQNKIIIEQNKQLEKLNNEKNTIFSIVSHDLRGPIDSISGYLEILHEGLLNEEEKNMMEEELVKQTKYTADMLLNLLYWSRSQMNGVTVKLAPCLLIDIVEYTRAYKVNTASKKGIKLTYSIPKDLEIIADRDMLQIVMRNLVNNAIKFSNKDGEISINVKFDKEKAIISLKDNGIGIPEDKKQEIFSVRSSTRFGTGNEKGIGLGLMLCKELVTYMKGDIWFESIQGVGTTFYISLPVSKA